MALPTPKSVAAPSTASVAAPVAGVETATKTKVAIKQFGKARTEADAEGNTQQIPAPKPMGVDFVALLKDTRAFVKGQIEGAKLDWDSFVTACQLDKPSVPGHKEGRATYTLANSIVSLDKAFDLLTKERGVGGAAKLKQVIEKKDALLATMRAKLLALGEKEEDINAILNG